MKMRTFLQNKLWRDKAVAMMEKHGSVMHYRHLNDAEFSLQLKRLLVEEAQEVLAAQSRDELVQELADLQDVIGELCNMHSITPNEIAAAQAKKYEERGGFSQRTFVEKAEHPERSFGEQYCLAQPKKYPEIITERECL